MRLQIVAFLFLSLGTVTCGSRTGNRIEPLPSKPIPANPDCFEAAQGNQSNVVLQAPTTVQLVPGERNLDVPVRLVNASDGTGLINRRAVANSAWMPGEDEFTVRVLTSDRQVLTNRNGIKRFVQGSYPVRSDYSELESGHGLDILLPIDRNLLPKEKGEYFIELCFWDRFQQADEFGGGKPILRGPSKAAPIRLMQ